MDWRRCGNGWRTPSRLVNDAQRSPLDIGETASPRVIRLAPGQKVNNFRHLTAGVHPSSPRHYWITQGNFSRRQNDSMERAEQGMVIGGQMMQRGRGPARAGRLQHLRIERTANEGELARGKLPSGATGVLVWLLANSGRASGLPGSASSISCHVSFGPLPRRPSTQHNRRQTTANLSQGQRPSSPGPLWGLGGRFCHSNSWYTQSN